MSRFSKIGVRTAFPVLLIFLSIGFARIAIATIYTCNLACSNAAGGGGIYLGRTYDIIFTTQTFSNTTAPAYNLQTTAWWGNSALARGLATVVGNPPGGGDPDFAYRLQSNLTTIDYYHYSENSARNASESVTFNTMFAFGTEVTVPEIDGGMLPKAALLLFSLYLLRISRHMPLSPDKGID
ncbi:hypothetical protein [Methylocystis echinoides]|nr:hypothetical protein [Methylocystis echinoides]